MNYDNVFTGAPELMPTMVPYGIGVTCTDLEVSDAARFFKENYAAWLGNLDIGRGWYAVIDCSPTHQYAVRATLHEAETVGADYFGSDPYVIFRIP